MATYNMMQLEKQITEQHLLELQGQVLSLTTQNKTLRDALQKRVSITSSLRRALKTQIALVLERETEVMDMREECSNGRFLCGHAAMLERTPEKLRYNNKQGDK